MCETVKVHWWKMYEYETLFNSYARCYVNFLVEK